MISNKITKLQTGTTTRLDRRKWSGFTWEGYATYLGVDKADIMKTEGQADSKEDDISLGDVEDLDLLPMKRPRLSTFD